MAASHGRTLELSASSPSLRADLALLFSDSSPDTLEAFAGMALSPDGPPAPTRCAAAARRLGTDPASVSRAIDALAFVFSDAARHGLQDVTPVLVSAGAAPAAAAALSRAYSAARDNNPQQPPLAAPPLLRWRLDVPLATRALPTPSASHAPRYVLSLSCPDASQPPLAMECDVPTLLAVADELERALKLTRASGTRRVVRLLGLTSS